MSLDEEARGAAWVLTAFDHSAAELNAPIRERRLVSPQEAGGEYFDRGLYVMIVIDAGGHRHKETFPEEHLADLHRSQKLRAELLAQITSFIQSFTPPPEPPKRRIGF